MFCIDGNGVGVERERERERESCHKYLLRQKFCHDKHNRMFVATKHIFCRDKNILVASKLLSRQNYVCRDKHAFVLSLQIFVATSILLSRQARVCVQVMSTRAIDRELPQVSFLSRQRFCHDKHDKTFVVTKLYLSQQNIVVMTKRLSRQIFVATNTPVLLSRQK